MVDTLTLADIHSRIESLTLSTSANYAHWDSTRKTQLANEAMFEVFKTIVESFEELFFFTVSGILTPVSNTISLDALDPPFYRLRAFQKLFGADWLDVDLVSARDASRRGNLLKERWYPTGGELRSDQANALTGSYRVMYNHRPHKMVNNGDVCPIPVEYSEMVPLYGAMEASLQSKANDNYALLLSKYEMQRQEMRKSGHNRYAARKRRVIDALGLQGGRDYIYIGDS